MNQNESDNKILNCEHTNESSNDKKTTASNEPHKPIDDSLNKSDGIKKIVSTGDNSVADICSQNFPTKIQSVPPTLQCATIFEAMPYLDETTTNKDVTLGSLSNEKSTATTKSVELLMEAQHNISAYNVSSNNDITSPSPIASPLITATTTTTTSTSIPTPTPTSTIETIASPPTSSAADIRQLHHVASAPILSCVALRANQQQQQKIKNYHDTKQIALWDTKSSMSSGGAILKSGISISAYGSPKMIRKSSESSSCGVLPRRVSFPKSDNELVTGYLEPANPWEHVATVNSVSEIADLYIKSCHKHSTRPLPDILEQLKTVELNKLARQPILMLKNIQLLPGDCEALEEILKRIQYKCIDLSSCELEETAISAICDIIEYYEATNELIISTNPKGMTQRGWISCAYMVGHSQELHVLNAEGNPISKISAEHLGNALNTSNLHTVKLEHCGLKGPPLNGLCLKIRHNKTLKELWLAHNDLDCSDAESIADLLKVNHYLELVDISNNNIGDAGLKHIVEALIVQSKELERRSMFQRAAAIEDDIFSPNESPFSTEASKFEDKSDNKELTNVFENTKNEENADEKLIDKDNITIANECSKTESAPDALILDLDAFSTNVGSGSFEKTTLSTEETEAEDDTEDTVKSNTLKSKQQSVGSGGQSMLDKLLSMNSDSSSEEGVSNLSTDTIAACGSDDASFVSDDIFEIATSTTTTNTCTKSKVNTSVTTATATIPTLQPSLTSDSMMISFESLGDTQSQFAQKNMGDHSCTEMAILCDTCTTEANKHCECTGNKKEEQMDSMTLSCSYNNYNINSYNNNNNPNIVQNHQNELREREHNQENLREIPDQTSNENVKENPNIFELTAEESDCVVPCSTSTKSNVLLLQNPTSAVDVNKNTRLAEDYDDTHSTDSAFESASEGDISRNLPEEFTRLSTSLESTRLDDISKELAIETATIATESIEYLAEAGSTASESTFTKNTLPLVKVGTQKSDEVKTKDVEVRFCETVLMQTNDASQNVKPSDAKEHHECLHPNVSTDPEIVSYVKDCEHNNSPIPTPPPPSTSPGGASLSMRRTDSSCNFITQSTRNHSQSSDSLCSDNSLDGSVNDLNSSTSAQLNEKLTKNDTLSRQSRQCDTVIDNSNRAPGGLKALAVWNNNLTKEAGLYISDLLADTTSLELLNIGKNCLSNDFVVSIKDSLTKNTTLTTLGLQSAHLSAKGIETLSSILAFGGNSTLQRIDIRDNKLEVESLTTLSDALKSNTTVTQIDIDDEPKRLSVGSDAHLDYVRVVENIRSKCSRNEKTQSQIQAEKMNSANSNKRRGGYYVGSRKISLTCHSRPLVEYSVAPAVTMSSAANKLEVKRKTGVRLRSPVPSPPTVSPSSSPNRSRFQVFRVNEVSPLTSPCSNSAPVPNLSSSADSQQPTNSLSTLTTSSSLPSMATVTSSTQTVRRLTSSPRSRFHVSKIYEDPKVPLSKRSLPPITPPIHLPPTPMLKSAPKDKDTEQSHEECCSKDKEIITQTENTLKNFDNDAVDSIDTKEPTETAQTIRCPIAVFNENDITLTHSSSTDIRLSTTDKIDSNNVKTKDDVPVTDNSTFNTAPQTQQIERKVSWIGNPTAVEKLLTLFQNPVTIFQRCSSPELKNMATNSSASISESTSSTSQMIPATNSSQIAVPPLKQSPPTRSKLGSDMSINVSSNDAEKSLTSEQPKSFLGAASKQLRDFGKQVFRQNVSAVSEITAGNTDNLLNLIPTALTEGNEIATKINSKLENNTGLKAIDASTEGFENISLEKNFGKKTLTDHTQNSLAGEEKTEIPVDVLAEGIKINSTDAE